MKYLKKFNMFEAVMTKPKTSPSTTPAPTTTPAPSTRPTPSRPSPIRRDRPAVEPDPMAKKKKDINRATEDEVVERFLGISKKVGFDYKKYFEDEGI